MTKRDLIFVPVPAVGHIGSTMGFANRLLDQDDHIKVTILVMKMPTASFVDSYVKSLAGANPRIELIQLPEIVYPPQELLVKALECYVDALTESYKPAVRTAVSEIISSRSASPGQSTRVAALILDFCCATMIDIGNEFGVPSYIFFASSAGFFSFLSSLPGRHKEVGREFKTSDPELSLPAFANPVPVQVLPSAVFNMDGGYVTSVRIASRYIEAKGIVINTFAELESYTINSFSDGEIPQVYPVGPVVNLVAQPNPELDHDRWDKIMKWLDEQPQSSVLFLCFGSAGSFSAAQVEEIALGLDRRGCRFLWSLCAPRGVHDAIHFKNPEEVLPEGFLERIGERGIVCGWAPQVEVLGHKSIGGFMSHCGWNSILESLWRGVPIVTLPIYAEQQLNAFIMVEELGLAEKLRLDYKRDHLVKADEIEKAVKRVMRSDSAVRTKMKKMREMARKAVMEGGSSSLSIAKFIKDIENSSS